MINIKFLLLFIFLSQFFAKNHFLQKKDLLPSIIKVQIQKQKQHPDLDLIIVNIAEQFTLDLDSQGIHIIILEKDFPYKIVGRETVNVKNNAPNCGKQVSDTLKRNDQFINVVASVDSWESCMSLDLIAEFDQLSLPEQINYLAMGHHGFNHALVFSSFKGNSEFKFSPTEKFDGVFQFQSDINKLKEKKQPKQDDFVYIPMRFKRVGSKKNKHLRNRHLKKKQYQLTVGTTDAGGFKDLIDESLQQDMGITETSYPSKADE